MIRFVHSAGNLPPQGNHRVAIWGQSNAVGDALISDLGEEPLVSSDAGLATLAADPFTKVLIGSTSYAALEIGVNHGSSATKFGPEFGLAVRFEREAPAGARLYLEKTASAAVAITYFHPEDETNVYGGIISARATADSWLSGEAVTLDSDGWLWVQGESDAAQTQAYYQEKLEDIIAEMVLDGFSDATDIRVLAQMIEGSDLYGAGVAAAKVAIAAADPNFTKLITFSNYLNVEDNVHLTARGQVQLGYDAYEKLFTAPHLDA